ncbi:hypothetical protein GCM10022281_09280 [Sphingomonas rosea]|uniref:Helix-turn-helix domain-containing protein n=1 Tax=Sphingomonas rosea TaxID=335605 RepID=A0ABP7TVJ1_9SPHN
MSDSSSATPPPAKLHKRWTPQRQFLFLATLDRTRCATMAAKAAGLSRESAYRCRKRDPGGLFALMWDEIMARKAINGVTVRDLRRDPLDPWFALRMTRAGGSLAHLRTLGPS